MLILNQVRLLALFKSSRSDVDFFNSSLLDWFYLKWLANGDLSYRSIAISIAATSRLCAGHYDRVVLILSQQPGCEQHQSDHDGRERKCPRRDG